MKLKETLKKIFKKTATPALTWFQKKYQFHYKQNCRRRLKNKHFTLITSTCLGGVLYNNLGLQFESPTINLWIAQPEFYKFCADMEYYLGQELSFYHRTDRTCPCAYLGQGERRITVVFVHYATREEAEAKWNERKKRIYQDNLYILSSDGNGATLEDFKLLEDVKCKRKIIFTSTDRPEIKDSFRLYSLRGQESAAAHMITINKRTGLRTWEHEFDYVAWLNGAPDFRKRILPKKRRRR